MPMNPNFLCCIGAELKNSTQQTTRMSQVYLYRSFEDETLSDMLSAGFFNAAMGIIRQDDLLLLYSPNETTAKYTYARVSSVSSSGVVITPIGIDASQIAVDTTGYSNLSGNNLQEILNNLDTTITTINNAFVRKDGSSIMTGPLKFRAGSFEGAIAGGLGDGISVYKLKADGSIDSEVASLTKTNGFVPGTNNAMDIGRNNYKWKDAYIARVITAVINNGYDIAIPATTNADTFALRSDLPGFNVKDFGAKGDGITDDSMAFQTAIDYANSIGGGIVYGNGNFLIERVYVKSNVIIANTRIKCKIISSAAWNNIAACFIFPDTCIDSSIINCFFDGDSANQTQTYVDGIILDGKRNSIKNCTLQNIKYIAIEINPGTEFCSIENNHIHDSLRAVYHTASETKISSYCNITGNLIENLDSGGIGFAAGMADSEPYTDCAGISYFNISNNIIKNVGRVNKQTGAIGGYSKNNKHLIISNNLIDTVPNHAMHFGGKFIEISNNIIKNVGIASGSDNYGDAIFIRNWPNVNGHTSEASNINIENNIIDTTISTAHGRGIAVENSKNVSICGNTVSNTQNDGIKVRGKILLSSVDNSDIIISNNNILKTSGGNCIYVSDTTNCQVSGNTCSEATSNGIIVVDVTKVIVSNNTSHNNGASGIRISATNISTPATSDVKLNSNICNNNTNYGIWAQLPFDKINVIDNSCSANTAGQYSMGTFTNSWIVSNYNYRTKIKGQRLISNGTQVQHFLAKTPTYVNAKVLNRHDCAVSIDGVTSTYVTFYVYDLAGNIIADNVSIMFEASCE